MRKTLRSRFLIKLECFFIVLRFALPFLVHPTEIDLSVQIALLSGFLIKLSCFLLVFAHAAPFKIHFSESDLSMDIALLSGFLIKLCHWPRTRRFTKGFHRPQFLLA